MDMSRSLLLPVLCLLVACGPGELDDEGAEGTGADEGSAALDDACPMGCDHVATCAPDEFSTIYASQDECVEACHGLYEGCVSEALVYFDCVVELSCDVVPDLLTMGPGVTACGPSFDAAESACGR